MTYILLEGMPCTGKTTIAQSLSKKLNAYYMKSVVSNTEFGSKIKTFRDKSPIDMDYFYLIDGILDELRVRDLLKRTNVVRDKCHIASLGHLNVQGFASDNKSIQDAISHGYHTLSSYSIEPDLIVFFNPNLEKSNKYLFGKSDCSIIDTNIIADTSTYIKQSDEIKEILKKTYSSKLIEIEAFSKSVEQICEEIISNII